MDTERVRPWRRRKYQVAAAAAGIAVVSAGVLTAALGGTDRTASTLDTRADLMATPAPSATPNSPATSGSPGTSGSTKPSAPGASAAPRRVPPPVYPNASVVPTVSESGSLPKDRRTLRVVSARGDLTGSKELLWVADGGHPVGNARCSQKFRFNAKSAVTEKPTLLICWRTSAIRSVYTVAVNLDGRPSEKASVATIDKVWAELG
jgi:hypothetical protein